MHRSGGPKVPSSNLGSPTENHLVLWTGRPLWLSCWSARSVVVVEVNGPRVAPLEEECELLATKAGENDEAPPLHAVLVP